ncbi:MAG: hypothetical protein SFU99_21000 [Saprospiraceae bacterium]|nr:hypothetical protein [Saprospiraceae bacterium]
MNTLKKHTIQVFEHQLLRIDEAKDGFIFTKPYYDNLAAFAEQHSEKYYSIQRNGIRFSHYVGALQVNNLTIEILPKTDITEESAVQKVLLDLLRECRILRPEAENVSYLSARKGNLLDLYIAQFLSDTEKLLHQGLIKTFHSVTENRRSLKGRLLLHKQLIQNAWHQERFYTAYNNFDYHHPYNQLIYEALQVLKNIVLHPVLLFKIQELLHRFPNLPRWTKPYPAMETLKFNQQSNHYASAIRTALLILQHFQPDVRAGNLPVLAILFDMNALFEEFVFRQLQKAADDTISIQRQVRRSFWEQRYLQPDILLTMNNQRIVLDTKWKRLKKVKPEMDDLRQMFVYNQYFDAARSVLMYPKIKGLNDLPPVPFQPTSGSDAIYACQIIFIELEKNSILNQNLGNELLEKINTFNINF